MNDKQLMQALGKAVEGCVAAIERLSDTVQEMPVALQAKLDEVRDYVKTSVEGISKTVEASATSSAEQLASANVEIQRLGDTVEQKLADQSSKHESAVKELQQIIDNNAKNIASWQEKADKALQSDADTFEATGHTLAEIQQTVKSFEAQMFELAPRIELAEKAVETVRTETAGTLAELGKSVTGEVEAGATELSKLLMQSLDTYEKSVADRFALQAEDFSQKRIEFAGEVSSVREEMATQVAAVGQVLADTRTAMQASVDTGNEAIERLVNSLGEEIGVTVKSLSELGDKVGTLVTSADERFTLVDKQFIATESAFAGETAKQLAEYSVEVNARFDEVAEATAPMAKQLAELAESMPLHFKQVQEFAAGTATDLMAAATEVATGNVADVEKRFTDYVDTVSRGIEMKFGESSKQAEQLVESSAAETLKMVSETLLPAHAEGIASTYVEPLAKQLADTPWVTVVNETREAVLLEVSKVGDEVRTIVRDSNDAFAKRDEAIEAVAKSVIEHVEPLVKQLAEKPWGEAVEAVVTDLNEYKQKVEERNRGISNALNQDFEKRDLAIEAVAKLVAEIDTVSPAAAVQESVTFHVETLQKSIAEVTTGYTNAVAGVAKSVDVIKEATIAVVDEFDAKLAVHLERVAETNVGALNRIDEVQKQLEDTVQSVTEVRTIVRELPTVEALTDLEENMREEVGETVEAYREATNARFDKAIEAVSGLGLSVQDLAGFIGETVGEVNDKIAGVSSEVEKSLQSVQQQIADVPRFDDAELKAGLDEITKSLDSFTTTEQFATAVEQIAEVNAALVESKSHVEQVTGAVVETVSSQLAAHSDDIAEATKSFITNEAFAVFTQQIGNDRLELGELAKSHADTQAVIAALGDMVDERLAKQTETVDQNIATLRVHVEKEIASFGEAPQVDENQIRQIVKSIVPEPAELPAPTVELDIVGDELIVTLGIGGVEKSVALPIKTGMNYAGIYEQSKQYKAGDVVTSKGSTWIAHKGQTGAPGTDTTGWQLMVKRGADGRSVSSYSNHTPGNKYNKGDFLRLHNQLWLAAANTALVPEGSTTESTEAWTLIGAVK